MSGSAFLGAQLYGFLTTQCSCHYRFNLRHRDVPVLDCDIQPTVEPIRCPLSLEETLSIALHSPHFLGRKSSVTYGLIRRLACAPKTHLWELSRSARQIALPGKRWHFRALISRLNTQLVLNEYVSQAAYRTCLVRQLRQLRAENSLGKNAVHKTWSGLENKA